VTRHVRHRHGGGRAAHGRLARRGRAEPRRNRGPREVGDEPVQGGQAVGIIVGICCGGGAVPRGNEVAVAIVRKRGCNTFFLTN